MVVRKYEGYYWRDEVGYDGRGICGTDHLPEIGPAVLPFFGCTPPTAFIEDRRNWKGYDLLDRLI